MIDRKPADGYAVPETAPSGSNEQGFRGFAAGGVLRVVERKENK